MYTFLSGLCFLNEEYLWLTCCKVLFCPCFKINDFSGYLSFLPPISYLLLNGTPVLLWWLLISDKMTADPSQVAGRHLHSWEEWYNDPKWPALFISAALPEVTIHQVLPLFISGVVLVSVLLESVYSTLCFILWITLSSSHSFFCLS